MTGTERVPGEGQRRSCQRRPSGPCLLVVLLLAGCWSATFPAFLRAELVSTSAAGFLLEHRYEISVTPEEAWEILVHPERYWPEDHTWSGSRSHLSLEPEAGGCFCERWEAGSVEHARVVMALPGRVLRLRGGLGPLQEMALSGVLTVTLAASDDGVEAVVTYRVSGDPQHQLEALAAVVDQVVGQQFQGFADLASSP